MKLIEVFIIGSFCIFYAMVFDKLLFEHKNSVNQMTANSVFLLFIFVFFMRYPVCNFFPKQADHYCNKQHQYGQKEIHD